MITIFGPFFFLAAVIFFAGRLVSRYGDEISSRTGIGGGWVGFILIAAVTSLPELAASLSAVIAGLPDMAVGDLLGSNLFNLSIISCVLLFFTVDIRRYFYSRTHYLKVLIGASMAVVVVIAALINMGSLIWIGTGSLLLWILYFGGVKLAADSGSAEGAGDRKKGKNGVKNLVVPFLASSALIVAAGILLVFWAEKTAQHTGWNTTFMGALFLAIATSLPEVSVALSAFRIGAGEMGLGNIFGSNAFNLALIPLLDIVYVPGNIFGIISPRNVLLGAAVVLMSGLVMFYLGSRDDSRRWRMAFTLGIALLYLLSMYGVYRIN